MQNTHIFRDFDNAIRVMKDEVLSMASMTKQNLERAMRALLERDLDLARAVIADDSDVDDSEVRVDQLGMGILVRFHPVASDLRMVIASMKIANNLERMSDHAVAIAKRAKKISKGVELVESAMCEPLYTLAAGMLRDALRAYTDGNSALGESLALRDKDLNRMHKKLIATLSARLEEGAGRTEQLLHLIFVVRSLERVGDLAVNIGEDAVFLEQARDIRHEGRDMD